jgi:hypothetical protein
MVVVSAADHVKNKFAVLRCTNRGGGDLEVGYAWMYRW